MMILPLKIMGFVTGRYATFHVLLLPYCARATAGPTGDL